MNQIRRVERNVITFQHLWTRVTLAVAAVTVLATAAPADTLLLHSISSGNDSWVSDIQSKLTAAGRLSGDVHTHRAWLTQSEGIPSLATLQQYESVIVVAHSSWENPTGLGNVLADYVDAGGGLVLAMNTLDGRPAEGRLLSGGYYPITPAPLVQGTPLTLGTIHDPAHPIMTDVSSFAGGDNSFHTTGALAGGAELVAEWSNGRPLVATLNGVVALNFFPTSADGAAPSWGYWDPQTDGAILMANALNYAAGNFVPAEDDPPAVVPLPAAAGGGLVLMGLLAGTRARRRGQAHVAPIA